MEERGNCRDKRLEAVLAIRPAFEVGFILLAKNTPGASPLDQAVVELKFRRLDRGGRLGLMGRDVGDLNGNVGVGVSRAKATGDEGTLDPRRDDAGEVE